MKHLLPLLLFLCISCSTKRISRDEIIVKRRDSAFVLVRENLIKDIINEMNENRWTEIREAVFFAPDSTGRQAVRAVRSFRESREVNESRRTKSDEIKNTETAFARSVETVERKEAAAIPQPGRLHLLLYILLFCVAGYILFRR